MKSQNQNQLSDKRSGWLYFLKWFCPPSLYESIEGDLLEQLEEDARVIGVSKAKRRLAWNVLCFFRPGIILRNQYTMNFMKTILLVNYIKISFRNLIKHSSFSAINIFGLAISMSICLIAIMSIKDQLSYDTFHPYAERTFRIITEVKNQNGEKYRFASSPLPVASQLEKEYDVAGRTVKLYPAISGKMKVEKREFDVNGAFTDPAFFNVFGFKLEAGDKRTALNEPNSIILSKETAIKFFGDTDPIGRMISSEKLGDFQITGVLEHQLVKSHIDFDVFVSTAAIAALEEKKILTPALERWNVIDVAYTYVLLSENKERENLDAALNQMADKLNQNSDGGGTILFESQALNRITPGREELQNDISGGQSWTGILGVCGVTLVILLSACFNYTNLSLARSLARGKEVGIRKLAGAMRAQLFSQFIIESVMISLIAVLIAYQLLQLMIRYAPFSSEVIPDVALDFTLIISFISFGLFTGIVAGVIPAWLLSSFQPVRVLKNISNIRLLGGVNLHKSLLVFQFGLSLVLVIMVSVTYKQFNYMATANYGFRKENLLNIPLNGADHQALSNELHQLASVKKITATSAKLGRHTSGRASLKTQEGEAVSTDYYYVDQNFLSVMQLTLLEGRNFPEQLSSDQEEYIIVNEQALKKFKISKEDAIGSNVLIDDDLQVQIIGVVKDFNYKSLSFSIQPLMFRYHPQAFSFLQIEVAPETDRILLLSNVERIYKRLNPEQSFSYGWFDEELHNQNSAWGTVSLLGFLAFMTASIACLGLLGMVVYTSRTRRKEMSIRKVMGATVVSLITLLSRNFIKLLFIAGGIALPMGYILGLMFLQLFAYHISIDILTLIGGFISLLIIGLITISSQTIKTANVNPTENLRSE